MKHITYRENDLITIDKTIHTKQKDVTLTGTTLTVAEILSTSQQRARVILTNNKTIRHNIEECYTHMITDVKNGVPIYGCNTGYGARAEIVVNKGNEAQRLQLSQAISESIVHTDMTVGPQLSSDVVRGAMLIRINMLMQGVSAVRIQDLELYASVLNLGITPVVNAYGGLGASGDLAHNSRVLSVMRQLPGVKAQDENGLVHEAKKLLSSKGVSPLVLEPKAGLGLVNGDNFSTSAATQVVSSVVKYTLIADVLGAMVVEALKGTNRTFHPFLSEVRPHEGQRELARLYRYLLNGSKLAHQELTGQVERAPGVNVQDAYSLRCITQSEGFNREQIKWALDTITINANSVSDNPLWVTPDHVTTGETPWQWVSGGNFFAMHMAEVIDSMRKIITRLIKRNDRQLHRLVSPHMSNGLPANLSDSQAISGCAFKGIQLQSGMFDVYSMMLAQPVTTMFGIHEENNQDITPHSLTSAIMAWENLRLLKYSLAMNLLAVAQAVDLRGGAKLLSSKTRPVYEFIRARASYVEKERPLAGDIETVAETIENGVLHEHVQKNVLSAYSSE